MMKHLLILIFFFGLMAPTRAQQPNPVLIKAELHKRGLTEEEVRAKLLEKGINPDEMTPQELAKAAPQIEAAIKELEAEKAAQNAAREKRIEKVAAKKARQKAKAELQKEVKKLSADAAKQIEKAVEKGKSVDEAISEQIQETKNQHLPPAGIFGHHIFRNKSIKVYNQASDIRAPETYELGPGDIVNISIWGYSELSKSYEVTEDGYIKPARMKPIFVKGITLANAKQLLRKAFSRYYNFRADEFAVNLNYSRTITVNITGEAIHPGSYTLPAINTAFNALVASGGPSDIGSVREITLVRPGKQPVKIDVYAFLENPAIAQNLYLQDGDYIHIPVIKKVVSIGGAVVRPYKYELTEGERLGDLIRYAGGFAANAYRNKIQIRRFENGEEKLIDVDAANANATALRNGDKVSVFTIPKVYENYVSINGEVKLPGEYELEKGWRVSDLLAAGQILPTSKLDLAFLRRINPDGTIRYFRINPAKILENSATEENLILLPKDQITIFAQKQFVDQDKVSIGGAVRQPVEVPFTFGDSLHVEDLVQMANGVKKNATDFAFIYRKPSDNSKEIQYILVDLAKALRDPKSAANILLQPNDRLTVPSKDNYLDKAEVIISGAVRNPGQYNYDISLTLNKLLLMAGGVQRFADKSRVEIYRLNFDTDGPIKTDQLTVQLNDQGLVDGDDVLLLPFDEVRVRSLPEFELQRNVTVNGEVRYPGVYSITEDNERLLTVLEKAGGLTKEAFPPGATLYRQQDNVGYIVIRLDEALKNKKSRFNMVLAKGDIITIPKIKDYVAIEGATRARESVLGNTIGANNRINVPFHPGRRANFYVEEYAGGISKNGRKRLISVRYPNGQLKQTKNFVLFNVYPKVTKGATIHVGAEARREKKETERKPVDWSKLLGDTIAQATTIITLLLLIQRIN